MQRSLRGGVAGAVATVVMTLEEPLDQRLFDSNPTLERRSPAARGFAVVVLAGTTASVTLSSIWRGS
jgi:hypothetical protein